MKKLKNYLKKKMIENKYKLCLEQIKKLKIDKKNDEFYILETNENKKKN